MTRTKGQKILLTAVLLAAGLAAFILYGGMGVGSDFGADSAGGEVRMEVDTTVIPSDAPPAPPSAQDEATAAQAPPVAPASARDEGAVPAEASPAESATAETGPEAAPAVPAETASGTAAADTPVQAQAPATQTEALPAAGGNVTAASVESSPDRFVLTVVCDRPAGETAVMTLASPDRVVLDILGSWRLKTPNVIRKASGPVLHVVIGAHPDKMRFVVHFRDGARLPAPGGATVSRQGKALRLTVPLSR